MKSKVNLDMVIAAQVEKKVSRETIVHGAQNARSLRAMLPGTNISVTEDTIVVFRPFWKRLERCPNKTPFAVYSPSAYNDKHPHYYANYEDFVHRAQPAEEFLAKYYHVDEFIFGLAADNPYMIFHLCFDWKKGVEDFGRDFTGKNQITGENRAEMMMEGM